MAAPPRGNTGQSVYFITASTFQRRQLFQRELMAQLFVEILFGYRDKKNYLLHEFVLMPDHFHLLLSPTLSLERSLQLIKGGFSYRARKELGDAGEIWQSSYYDRRVRCVEEYFAFKNYIRQNPMKRGLAPTPEEYPYSSAHSGFELDEVSERMKQKLIA
jgi:putative transposase